ncbi:acid phosphatase 1 isoform X2 [Phoenix dactylifera]|uniref:Acid phosphatase 1 isoform X2 n=1 Tax=Phoenix dactylifera TaxID=42345 RepID=A0A8B7CCL4_PHODC|nr:acid phosphatase 1 isoform X2 [Phoenix dactylifera]
MEKRRAETLLLFFIFSIAVVAGDWNILSYMAKKRDHHQVGISLKNYCESWRMNAELNNIRCFDVVPGECVGYIGKYMTSTQYKVDVQRAAEEATLFLTNSFLLGGDGKDAWVFDIDDTLLSTVPYFKKHQFGGATTNRTSMEQWMEERSAPAVKHMLNLYHEIRARGLKVFLISSRREHLRDATIDNLVKVGYLGWAELILRCSEDSYDAVASYKAEQMRRLMDQGYRLWGIMGDQWSSLVGHPSAERTFKLPNPMYYDA